MEKILYTGFFFNKFVLAQVLHGIRLEFDAEKLADQIDHPHVTTTFKPDAANEKLFDAEAVFRITGYGNDRLNEGIRVELVGEHPYIKDEFSKIAVTPHITVSINKAAGAQPVNTHRLAFEPLKTPRYVIGTYGVCAVFKGEDGVSHIEYI